MSDSDAGQLEQSLLDWLRSEAGVQEPRRVAAVTSRQVVLSKFPEGFYDCLDVAISAIPGLFEAATVPVTEAADRSEAWRAGMERCLFAFESGGLLDSGQRAEVMAGVDSVAALLATVFWGPRQPGGATDAERQAFLDLEERLRGPRSLFTRHYGTFEGRAVVNHCPGAAHARRILALAWTACTGEPPPDRGDQS
jgi:hypothetical protein